MDEQNNQAERAELSDAEIAGIMGWRGPGAYTATTLRKIREVLAADRRKQAMTQPAPAAGTVEKDVLTWLCHQGWFQDAAGHFLDIPEEETETVAEFTRQVGARIRAAIEAHNRAGKEQG